MKIYEKQDFKDLPDYFWELWLGKLKEEIINTSYPLFLIRVGICEVRDGLNKEIVECNKYCRERNDFGGTHRQDDPHETISYTRGKSIGYICSRDEINKLIKNFT